MSEKVKFWLLQIFATKIGWLGLSLASMVIFGILGNFYDWAQTATLISLIYPVVFTLIMIVYAWIINPLNDLKERRKNKK